MRRFLAAGLLALVTVATAAPTPFTVATSLASSLNLVGRDTAFCNLLRGTLEAQNYPKVPKAKLKYISARSFVQEDSTGIGTLRSLIDLQAMAQGLEPLDVWQEGMLRPFVHAQTLPFAYFVGVNERPHPSNEFLKTVDMCVVIMAIR